MASTMSKAKTKANIARVNTDTAKNLVLEGLANGLTVAQACDAAGRHPKTYEAWRRNDAEFSVKVDRIRTSLSGGRKSAEPAAEMQFGEFSDKYLGAHVFPHMQNIVSLIEHREPEWVHESMIYEKGEPDLLIVNMPPEHGKTVSLTINYVTHRIAHNPNIRVIVVSKTQAMARKMLVAIKTRLTHPNYHELIAAYGPPGGFDRNAEAWSQDLFYVSSDIRDSGEKDPTVQALGIRGHIYGARADLIILDDCVDLTNAHEYEKQIEWLQSEVISRLADSGTLIVIGTRLASKDLYSELRDPSRYPDEASPWTYFAMPAVLEFADDPKDWKTLWAKTNMAPVGSKGEDREPDAEGLFPKWDGPRLFKKRGRMSPRTWAQVYQQAQVSSDAIFTHEAVTKAINGNRLAGRIPQGMHGCRPNGMEGLIVMAGLDPAMAGHTAAVCIGLDVSTQKRYILDVFNNPGTSPDGIRNVIKDWTLKYGVSEWRVEKNAFQAMLTQDREVREFLANTGAILREHHTGQNKWDVDFGVASLTTLFAGYQDDRQMIELPSTVNAEGVKALIEQLVTWQPDAPKGQKTDCVMALWFVELACRDRVSMIGNYGKSHSKNPFLTKWDKSQQRVINLVGHEALGEWKPFGN